MSDDVALLLRRAGFGPTSSELAAGARAGYAATLAALVSPAGADVGATSAPLPQLGPDPFVSPDHGPKASATRRAQTTQIAQWWLDRMTVADHQAVERLIFFWHGHWATSIARVGSPQLMLAQHQTLRDSPDFKTMARRMVVDPALLVWLDGIYNLKGSPNENLARELMELFTLGIGNYTENDVKQAARALTGWRIRLVPVQSYFDPNRHDGGRKTILGVTADFTAQSFVNLLLRQPACPRFIATRLWFRYASSSSPIPHRLREEMAAAFPAPLPMLRVMFADQAFRETSGMLVKQPIEWLVGAMRQLSVRPAAMPPGVFGQVMDRLQVLGQQPFAPPSVGGWPSGTAWLTSAATLARLNLAHLIAGLTRPTTATPEAMAHLLCIPGWTNRTYAVLRAVKNPQRLLALCLASPEYLVT